MSGILSPHFQVVDASGSPVSGAKLNFYQVGTTTQITTYQDAALTTPHTNPVIADSSGRFAPIYVSGGAFKTVLTTSDGTVIQTVENAYSVDGAAFGFYSTRSLIKGLSTSTRATAYLSESGREGNFVWDSSNLSATIAPISITSTTVDATTETITATAHGLFTADAVYTTSAVNGLSADTFYYVIKLDANSFKLASSFALAKAGTAFNLTGATNLTLKKHIDPLEAIYLIKTGDPLDGSSGAWVRVRDGNICSPTWAGADETGTTTSQEAFQAAINVLPVVPGGELNIPAGNFLLSGTLTVDNKNLKIRGAGRQSTRLRWYDDAATTSLGGIIFTTTDILHEFGCEGVHFVTDFAGGAGNTPISGTWPTTSSGQNRTCVIRDNEFSGSGSGYWTQLISLSEAWNCILEDNMFTNSTSTSEVIALAGMCGDAQINGNVIYNGSTGINVIANTEGIRVTDNAIIGVNIGVNYSPTVTGRPGTDISGNHISSANVGIRGSEAVQLSITKNLIYKVGNGDFIGIDLASNTDDCRVCDNFVLYISGTGTTTGISLADASNAIIHHNELSGLGTGIGAGATSTTCLITDNLCPSTTTPVSNGGVTNRIYNNWPISSIVTFSANDATPSIGGHVIDIFQTANTVATTITAFDDGYVGQKITVMANDANTTIQHNAGLILQGAANYAMANGAIITLRLFSSGLWREISRKT